MANAWNEQSYDDFVQCNFRGRLLGRRRSKWEGAAPGAGGMLCNMSTNCLNLAVMISSIRCIEMAVNASKARALFPRAGSGKKTRHEPTKDNNALLEGADVAWQQYKKGQGKRVTGSEELKDFLDSL